MRRPMIGGLIGLGVLAALALAGCTRWPTEGHGGGHRSPITIVAPGDRTQVAGAGTVEVLVHVDRPLRGSTLRVAVQRRHGPDVDLTDRLQRDDRTFTTTLTAADLVPGLNRLVASARVDWRHSDRRSATATISWEPAVDVSLAHRCDFLGQSRCNLPFPNNWFTVRDHTTDTGRRVNLAVESLPANTVGVHIDPTEFNRNDGFSPGAMILAHIPGVDLVASGAPPITDIGRSLEPDSPIVLVDAHTGEHWPFFAELDAHATSDANRAADHPSGAQPARGPPLHRRPPQPRGHDRCARARQPCVPAVPRPHPHVHPRGRRPSGPHGAPVRDPRPRRRVPPRPLPGLGLHRGQRAQPRRSPPAHPRRRVRHPRRWGSDLHRDPRRRERRCRTSCGGCSVRSRCRATSPGRARPDPASTTPRATPGPTCSRPATATTPRTSAASFPARRVPTATTRCTRPAGSRTVTACWAARTRSRDSASRRVTRATRSSAGPTRSACRAATCRTSPRSSGICRRFHTLADRLQQGILNMQFLARLLKHPERLRVGPGVPGRRRVHPGHQDRRGVLQRQQPGRDPRRRDHCDLHRVHPGGPRCARDQLQHAAEPQRRLHRVLRGQHQRVPRPDRPAVRLLAWSRCCGTGARATATRQHLTDDPYPNTPAPPGAPDRGVRRSPGREPRHRDVRRARSAPRSGSPDWHPAAAPTSCPSGASNRYRPLPTVVRSS